MRSRPRCRGRTGRRRTGRWPSPRWRAPRPISSPRRRSAGPASASTAPRPAMIAGAPRGRAAASAAARTDSSAGAGRRELGPSGGGSAAPSAACACTSSGSISTTGRRSTCARRTARATSAERRRRPVHALGDRADGLDEARLVDAEVRAQGGGGHVRGEHDQRRAGLGGLGQPGHRVRQPGSLVHAAHGQPRRSRARTRRPCRSPRTRGARRGTARRVAQRVGDGEVAAAHEAEDDVDPERAERPADRLGDST